MFWAFSSSSAGWEPQHPAQPPSPHKHVLCQGPGLSASQPSLSPQLAHTPRKCVRGLLTPLRTLLFLLFSSLRPFFMAMLLMVHIFQSNMFGIRPHNEVTTPSCAAPTQGSLPYIWSVHIWLRLTAGQMLHPSEPRPAASSARGWSCTHTHKAPPPSLWSTEGLRSSGSPRGARPWCGCSSCSWWGGQAAGTHLWRYANIRFPVSSPDELAGGTCLKPGSEAGAYPPPPPAGPAALNRGSRGTYFEALWALSHASSPGSC